MELSTSMLVIVMLYCTEWLGTRQCFALPLPTLANYHHGHAKNSWTQKYRETRYPVVYYEKFVFPNKQQDAVPIIIADRSAEDSSGKIFFPDDVPKPNPAKGNRYHYSTDGEVRPMWGTNHRPTSAVSNSSPSKWTGLDATKSTIEAEDGSTRMETPAEIEAQLSEIIMNAEMEANRNDDKKNMDMKAIFSPSNRKKTNDDERVKERVQEFYKWLITNAPKGQQQRQQQKGSTTQCPETGSSSTSNNMAGTSAATKPDSVVSDLSPFYSLVVGLKNQKCPEGQIRLGTGECKVTVEI